MHIITQGLKKYLLYNKYEPALDMSVLMAHTSSKGCDAAAKLETRKQTHIGLSEFSLLVYSKR